MLTTPDLEFGGFPFLTDVFSGKFGCIEVTLPAAEAEASEDSSLRAEDIEVTFHDVVTADNFRQATAESLTGKATSLSSVAETSLWPET